MAEKFGSRTKAADAIERGLVKVDGKAVAPSFDIKSGEDIQILQDEESFVSNGGYKLHKALRDFNFSVEEKIYADIGASNGGFTDCLFQNGAKKVYCIDVGESQLDKSLLDKNVVIIDNFNARNLNKEIFNDKLDGAVIDVSFISLTYILPNVYNVLEDGAYVIALIKPQFECESKSVGKNGIVKDSAVHKKIITKIVKFCDELGFSTLNLTNAPIKPGKNIEYLVLLQKHGKQTTELNHLFKYVKL
ncbi:MAG: TlyA family RNA methyltransferase [Clostridia bacterium]|nr:TlyA family RNA methyltransferase [Clostridia bacterium]